MFEKNTKKLYIFKQDHNLNATTKTTYQKIKTLHCGKLMHFFFFKNIYKNNVHT